MRAGRIYPECVPLVFVLMGMRISGVRMGMEKTAFASDFDGTLCESDWVTGEIRFDPVNMDAIHRYQAAGGLFGICTGRPLSSVLESLEGVLDLDFYIVMTGAQVLDRNLKVIRERTIEREVAQEIFERYASRESVMIAVTQTDFVSVRDRMGLGLPVVPSLDAVNGDLYGVSIECHNNEEAARVVREDLNRRFAGVVEGFQNRGSVDIVPAGCSKGAGVRLVREALGIDAMAGAGDSYNDLTLLLASDVSYTFDTSPREVRDAATVVVSTLSDAIEDFSIRQGDEGRR